jgi:hypothetical protein
MTRSHLVAMRDSLVGTGLLCAAFYFLHLRAKVEGFGVHDAIIVGVLVAAGLAIGYRDRLSLVVGAVQKALQAGRKR